MIREALLVAPGSYGRAVRDALISLATERTRTSSAALRDEMTAKRVAACDPLRVAEHFLHGLIGHFVAEAIAGVEAASREGAASPGRARQPRRLRVNGRTRIDHSEEFAGLLLPLAKRLVYDATVESFHALDAARAQRAADPDRPGI